MEMERFLIEIEDEGGDVVEKRVATYPVDTLYSDILDEVENELYEKHGGIGYREIEVTVMVIVDGEPTDPERDRIYVAN